MGTEVETTPNDVEENGDHTSAPEDLEQPRSAREVSDRVKRLFDQVPEIGTKWCRWYDLPYKVIGFFLWSCPRWLMPSVARHVLISGINFLNVFNEHERNKAEDRNDPMENLILPKGARLRQGGMWTIEIFPPSKFRSLEDAIHRNDWEQPEFLNFGETNVEAVKRGREGLGASWRGLISIAPLGKKHFAPDSKREELPAEIRGISLTAVQVGSGLTAVVAYFQFSENGESSLDQVWRKDHEPMLTWRGLKRPRIAGRLIAGIEATQLERQRIHGLARHWMAARCPGFFASRSLSHPVIDLNLFDGIDPMDGQDKADLADGFRALGMPVYLRDLFVSKELPGAVLIPTQVRELPFEPLQNCWAIAGESSKIDKENEGSHYGDTPYSAGTVGAMFNYPARSFLLYLSVMRYLREQRAVYSFARDLAAVRHRSFDIEQARKLSTELLETGLDLPTMARDGRELWSEWWRQWNGLEVKRVSPKEDQASQDDFDLIKAYGESSDKQFKELLEQDQNYRNVLSTAAALGANTESAQIGRRALFVAGCSMAVATVTLLITQTGDNSLLAMLISGVQGLFSSLVHLFGIQHSAHPIVRALFLG